MSFTHHPIPEHLRPHVWAKSMYVYPAFPNLPVHSIAEFLFQAITIATNTPFRWDFIDAPVPGSLLFVWMSPQTYASSSPIKPKAQLGLPICLLLFHNNIIPNNNPT